MKMPVQINSNQRFRAEIVRRILDGGAEDALQLLAKHFTVSVPKLRIGTVKGRRQVLGCYVQREACIYLSNSNYMTDPFVVLHEFYHHLRTSRIRRIKQAERRADQFAIDFIRDFHLVTSSRRNE